MKGARGSGSAGSSGKGGGKEAGGHGAGDEPSPREIAGGDPVPVQLLRSVEGMLARLFEHVDMLGRVGVVKRPPPLLAALTPSLEALAGLDERAPDALSLGEVLEVMEGIGRAAMASQECPEEVVRHGAYGALLDFPLQPAFAADSLPILMASALPPGPIPPVPPQPPPFPFDPQSWERFLDTLQREARDIFRRQSPSAQRAMRGAYQRLLEAIANARQSNTLGNLRQLLIEFVRALMRFGAGAGVFLQRILALIAGLFGGGGGAGGLIAGGGAAGGGAAGAGAGAAGGAAGGAAVVLAKVAALVLWFLLWYKIGCWLWNQEVGDSGRTYIDFWADIAYGLTTTSDCDELWRLVTRANDRVRELERSGAEGDELRVAAAVAATAVRKLLNECEVNIRSTLERWLARYAEIMTR